MGYGSEFVGLVVLGVGARLTLGGEFVEELEQDLDRALLVLGGRCEASSQPSGMAMCRTWPGQAWLQ
ncbi:hypothetical protein SAZ11_04445 [Streptomyces sp. FXJ1.4098]|nr:hypothetical protein [Streptomyces sp. FXJ1.4098]